MVEGMSEKTPMHETWLSRPGRNPGSQFQTNMTETSVIALTSRRLIQ
jgi:hypothetical protein